MDFSDDLQQYSHNIFDISAQFPQQRYDEHAVRPRSRSRPPQPVPIPASAPSGGIGPARNPRTRRNNSVSSTSPPPFGHHPHQRPHAIVIPGSNRTLGPLSASAGTPAGSWFAVSSQSTSASEYSLPTPDQHYGPGPTDIPHHHPSMHLPSLSHHLGNTTHSGGHGHHHSLSLDFATSPGSTTAGSIPKSPLDFGGMYGLGSPAASLPPPAPTPNSAPLTALSPTSPSSASASVLGGPGGGAALSTQDKQSLLANEKRRRRRESHNAVERRRRDNINEKISELATLIPECMLDGSVVIGSTSSTNANAGQGQTGSGASNAADSPPASASATAPANGGTPTTATPAATVVDPSTSTEPLLPSSLSGAPIKGEEGENQDSAVVKANKGMILRKSVEYIRYLQQLVTAQGARNRELEQELKTYRSGGVPPPGGSPLPPTVSSGMSEGGDNDLSLSPRHQNSPGGMMLASDVNMSLKDGMTLGDGGMDDGDRSIASPSLANRSTKQPPGAASNTATDTPPNNDMLLYSDAGWINNGGSSHLHSQQQQHQSYMNVNMGGMGMMDWGSGGHHTHHGHHSHSHSHSHSHHQLPSMPEDEDENGDAEGDDDSKPSVANSTGTKGRKSKNSLSPSKRRVRNPADDLRNGGHGHSDDLDPLDGSALDDLDDEDVNGLDEGMDIDPADRHVQHKVKSRGRGRSIRRAPGEMSLALPNGSTSGSGGDATATGVGNLSLKEEEPESTLGASVNDFSILGGQNGNGNGHGHAQSQMHGMHGMGMGMYAHGGHGGWHSGHGYMQT